MNILLHGNSCVNEIAENRFHEIVTLSTKKFSAKEFNKDAKSIICGFYKSNIIGLKCDNFYLIGNESHFIELNEKFLVNLYNLNRYNTEESLDYVLISIRIHLFMD